MQHIDETFKCRLCGFICLAVLVKPGLVVVIAYIIQECEYWFEIDLVHSHVAFIEILICYPSRFLFVHFIYIHIGIRLPQAHRVLFAICDAIIFQSRRDCAI